MLLAVHISDNILASPWWAAGFVGMAILLLCGSWRIRDEDIPRIALLAAAFFVIDLIHVSVGPTSAHLLLGGLMGVVLGRHAALAIPLAVSLQYALLLHGGYTTIGINSCVMALPALLAWQLFVGFQRVPWVRQPWFRGGLVVASVMLWTLTLVFCLTLLSTNRHKQLSQIDVNAAASVVFHPGVVLTVLIVALLVAWGERRLENAPEFPLGLLIGELSVIATTVLSGLVLVWGGQEDWPSLVLVMLVPHLFIAAIEGVILGFTIGFLARVKPDMLQGLASRKSQCVGNPGD
jgi:cobalt/nickel transport system permease protein